MVVGLLLLLLLTPLLLHGKKRMTRLPLLLLLPRYMLGVSIPGGARDQGSISPQVLETILSNNGSSRRTGGSPPKDEVTNDVHCEPSTPSMEFKGAEKVKLLSKTMRLWMRLA